MQESRILLKLIEKKDFRNLIPLLEKEITQWINPIPYPPTKKDLTDWLNKMSRKKNKTFVIIDKSNFDPIGMIWIENIKDAIGEIGFWIAKKFQGKGYVKEAGKIMIILSKNLKLKKLSALTVGHNVGSKRTLESLGFTLKKTIKKDFIDKIGNLSDVLIYEKML